jgi:hypothetical protein
MLKAPDFPIKDKNLPIKMAASFVLAAATITLPVALTSFVKYAIQNPLFSNMVETAIVLVAAIGGMVYLKNFIDKTVQNVATRIQPLYKADLDGTFMIALSSVGTGAFFDSLVAQYFIPNYVTNSSRLDVPTVVLAMTYLAYGAYDRTQSVLKQNNWRPPSRPTGFGPASDVNKPDHKPK